MSNCFYQNNSRSFFQNYPTDRGICNISQIVFWIEFICFMICMTWHYTYHTSVSFLKNSQIRTILEFVTLLAVFNIIFLCDYTRKQLLEILMLLLLLFISQYNSGYDDGYLLYSMAIALSCKKVHFQKLLQHLFYFYFIMLFSVLLLYRIGIFSPMRNRETRTRYNLGFSHYNTLGMVIVCIVMLWIFIRYEKVRWFDYFVWLAASVFVWEVPNSRTAALCIVLLTSGVFISKLFEPFRCRLVNLLALFSFPLMAIFSYLSSYLYTPDHHILSNLDELLSKRLFYGKSYLLKYPIPLLGQKIRRINPDAAAKAGIPPEILDNGYLRILLQLGILTFFVIMLIFIYIIYKALINKHYAVIIGLVVVSFYNISEYYMSSLFANPFLFFFTYYRYAAAPETDNTAHVSERTLSMKPYTYYGKHIDMKQFLHYLALHWFTILLTIMLTIVAASGFSIVKQIITQKTNAEKYTDGQKEITLSVNEEEIAALQQYLSDARLLDTYKSYSDKSLYMKIDANKVPHYAITYTFSAPEIEDTVLASDSIKRSINAMLQETKKDSFFDQLAVNANLELSSSENLRDLLSIGAANNTQINIELCAPDESTLTSLVNAFISLWENDILTSIKETVPQIEMLLQDQYIYTSRDTKIRDTQASILNQVSAYATKKNNDLNNLSDNAKKYLEQYEKKDNITLGEPITYSKKVNPTGISKRKAALAGLKAGSFAALCNLLLWLIVYLVTNRIWGIYTLAQSYHITRLGSFVPDENAERPLKRTNTNVWKFYHQHIRKTALANHELSFTLHSLLGLHGKNKIDTLLVLSDSLSNREQTKEQIHDFLCSEIAETVILLSAEELFMQESKALSILPKNVDALLLTTVMGCSTYAQIEQLISLSMLYEDKMIGYVMVE